MNYETELKTIFYFKNICVKARKKKSYLVVDADDEDDNEDENDEDDNVDNSLAVVSSSLFLFVNFI